MCLLRCAHFPTAPRRGAGSGVGGAHLLSRRPLSNLPCARICASVIPSLEVRPEDSGSSESLAPIPVGYRLLSALGDEGRDTGCEHAWGRDGASGEDSAASEGHLRVLSPVVGRRETASVLVCAESPTTSMSIFLGQRTLGAGIREDKITHTICLRFCLQMFH